MSENLQNKPNVATKHLRAPKARTPWMRHATGVMMLLVAPLYILSYRLVGIKAYYEWGAADVSTTTRPTKSQFDFSRMFPMLLALIVMAIMHFVLGVPIY